MTRYNLINGEKVAFTAEEETARDAAEIVAATELAANKYKNDRQFNGTKTYPNLKEQLDQLFRDVDSCLLYTSPSPRDRQKSRMPSSA